jgi:hypothetical protein
MMASAVLAAASSETPNAKIFLLGFGAYVPSCRGLVKSIPERFYCLLCRLLLAFQDFGSGGAKNYSNDMAR